MSEDQGEDREGRAEDPVAALILLLLAEAGPQAALDPVSVAKAFAATRARPKDPPDAWRRYLPAVRQQALHLARQDRIRILRKGAPVDPHAPVKGLIKLASVEN